MKTPTPQTSADANCEPLRFGEAFDEWLRLCIRVYDRVAADPAAMAKFEALTKGAGSDRLERE